MNNYRDRIYHFKGNPHEIGFAAGRMLGPKLEQNLHHYITRREHATNMEKLRQGALPWLRRLPKRFQEEYEGIARGANLPLQLLAEWAYIEECESNCCSAAIGLFENRVWVARNNDFHVPEMWGYVTIREVDGRIPTISFGMQGDVFAPTGINKEKLWLHHNFLPAWDQPESGKPHFPAYVFLTEALEVCRTLSDVEAFLNENNRDGGMALFAVDGKTNEFALFECLCAKHFRRDPSDGWIVGTNHFCACEDPTLSNDEGSASTLNRFSRMESLVQDLYTSQASAGLPDDLIRILADDEIEMRNSELMTVYSNVACPSSCEIWYTFGGYPAASMGNWQKLDWPWVE
jgi:hypothetical protein